MVSSARLTLRRAAVALVAIAGSAARAEAQDSPKREGFWIAPALGWSATRTDTDGPATIPPENGSGAALNLRLGGSLSQRVLLGAELAGWVSDTDSRGIAGITLLFYPSSHDGLYGRAVAGPAYRETSVTTIADFGAGPEFVNLTETASGAGIGGGAGYEIRLGRNLFLVPEITVHGHVIRSDWSVSAVAVIGLMWH